MPKATSKAPITTEKGLVIERRFTSPGVHPYDELEWAKRDAIIGDPEKPAFEQKGVEFPTTWSQNATKTPIAMLTAKTSTVRLRVCTNVGHETLRSSETASARKRRIRFTMVVPS